MLRSQEDLFYQANGVLIKPLEVFSLHCLQYLQYNDMFHYYLFQYLSLFNLYVRIAIASNSFHV